jgi:hypothetical protein
VFLSHKSLHAATTSRSARPSKLPEDQETEDTTLLHSYNAHKTKLYLHHKSILSEHIFIIYLHELKPQRYPCRESTAQLKSQVRSLYSVAVSRIEPLPLAMNSVVRCVQLCTVKRLQPYTVITFLEVGTKGSVGVSSPKLGHQYVFESRKLLFG